MQEDPMLRLQYYRETGQEQEAKQYEQYLRDTKQYHEGSSTHNTGLGATIIDNLAQGLTFGQARKIAAAAKTFIPGQEGFKKNYSQNLADIEGQLAAQQQENPTTSTLSELGGVVASPIMRLLGGVYKGAAPATALGRAAIGSATAGAGGAAYGAATAKPGDRLKAATTGGLLAGVTGGLASAPGSVLGRAAVGTGLGAATGGAIGELTGHPGSGAVLGGIAGLIGGVRQPVSEGERAKSVLGLLPSDAAQHMADVEAMAPGGSSLAGAAPRPDKPYQSRLWRLLKGVGADEGAGAAGEQAATDRLGALMTGRKAVGEKMNAVAGPIEVDENLEHVLGIVRKALGKETPGAAAVAEDPAVAQVKAMFPDDLKMQAAAFKQMGIDAAEESKTVDAEDLADALSTLNHSLREAERKGVDARGVRKYTLQKAHDALSGFLNERHPELNDLHRQYRVLSDEVRRLGNKGVLTKIADSRENHTSNDLFGKGAASVGGSISVGHAVHSPRAAAFTALQSLFRPDEAKAGAKFAAKYLLDPSMTPEVLRLLALQKQPVSGAGVRIGGAAAPLARSFGLLDDSLPQR